MNDNSRGSESMSQYAIEMWAMLIQHNMIHCEEFHYHIPCRLHVALILTDYQISGHITTFDIIFMLTIRLGYQTFYQTYCVIYQIVVRTMT